MRRTARFSDQPPIISGEATFYEASALTDDRRRGRDRQPFSHDLDKKMRQLHHGDFLIENSQFPDMQGSDNVRAEIVPLDELAQGRKESAHVVTFGQLLLRSDSDYEKNILVAVKPFDQPGDAVHEASAIRLVNRRIPRQLGSLQKNSGLNTLGLCRFEDGTAGLVTEYDPAISTYDNLFWNENESVQTELRVAKALGHCGLSLGRLHGAGFIHEDAQVKNMAADNYGNRYVDLEDMRYAPRGKDGVIAAEEFADDIRGDLSRFVESLTARSSDYDKSYAAQLDSDFWPTYSQALSESRYAVVRNAVASELQPQMRGDELIR